MFARVSLHSLVGRTVVHDGRRRLVTAIGKMLRATPRIGHDVRGVNEKVLDQVPAILPPQIFLAVPKGSIVKASLACLIGLFAVAPGSVLAQTVPPVPPTPPVIPPAVPAVLLPPVLPSAPAPVPPVPPPVLPAAPATSNVVEKKADDPTVDPNKVEPARSEIWQYFSAGILIDSYFQPSRAKAAEIRGGQVRVTDKDFVQVGVGLQASLPIPIASYIVSTDNEQTYQFSSEHAVGPYIGVSLGSGDVVNSVAVGGVYRYVRNEGGIMIGIGCAVDPVAQFLSTEFQENEAAPKGAEGVKFQNRPDVGLQVMISFTPGKKSDD